jgi:hypothetical protein
MTFIAFISVWSNIVGLTLDFRRETPATNPRYDTTEFVQQCS